MSDLRYRGATTLLLYQTSEFKTHFFRYPKKLVVSPLIPVAPGDFLGIFSGKLRYLYSKPLRAIEGPIPGLWLYYSEIPGKLNQMRVAKLSNPTVLESPSYCDEVHHAI